MTDTPGRPLALVTGASSGIGAAFAEALAHRGYDLIVVARRKGRLTAMAEGVKAASGAEIEVLAADLSESADIRRVADRLAQEPRLAMLVNNAGLGDIGAFADASPDAIDRMIAVNVTAVVQLTHAALPILKSRRGAIVNVSSGAAFMTMKGAAVYSGTKAFVTHFTRSLHEEVGESVRLQALIPGLTRTNLGGAEDSGFFDQFPAEWIMEPQDLVKASLAGLELGELVCIPAVEDLSGWNEARERLQALGMGVSSNRTAARYNSGATERSAP